MAVHSLRRWSSRMTCSSEPGPSSGSSASRSCVGGELPAACGAYPPRLPLGGGDQPADQGRRVVNVVQVRDQAHPHRLQHVFGIAGTQPGRARDLPEQRAEFGDDLAERILAALPGGPSQPAMRVLRSGWLARTVTDLRSVTARSLSASYFPEQPILFLAQFPQGGRRPLFPLRDDRGPVGTGRSRPVKPQITVGLGRSGQQRSCDVRGHVAGPRTRCRSRSPSPRGSRPGRAPRVRAAASPVAVPVDRNPQFRGCGCR